MIRYELERDLMPLILSNTQYSVERGQETLPEHDLAKIQQQLVSRFLLGKPLITLEVSGRSQAPRSFDWAGPKTLNAASALFPTEDSDAGQQIRPQLRDHPEGPQSQSATGTCKHCFTCSFFFFPDLLIASDPLQEPLQTLILMAVAAELQSYSEVCEALSTLDVALGFLAKTGGDPHMQLSSYLEEVLQMGNQTAPHILKVGFLGF